MSKDNIHGEWYDKYESKGAKGKEIEDKARELYEFNYFNYATADKYKITYGGDWSRARGKTKARFRRLAKHVLRGELEARIDELKNIPTKRMGSTGGIVDRDKLNERIAKLKTLEEG